MQRLLLFLFLSVAATFSIRAENVYSVHFTTSPVTVDAEADEPGWSSVPPGGGNFVTDSSGIPGTLATEQTTFQALWDTGYLYIFLSTQDANPEFEPNLCADNQWTSYSADSLMEAIRNGREDLFTGDPRFVVVDPSMDVSSVIAALPPPTGPEDLRIVLLKPGLYTQRIICLRDWTYLIGGGPDITVVKVDVDWLSASTLLQDVHQALLHVCDHSVVAGITFENVGAEAPNRWAVAAEFMGGLLGWDSQNSDWIWLGVGKRCTDILVRNCRFVGNGGDTCWVRGNYNGGAGLGAQARIAKCGEMQFHSCEFFGVFDILSNASAHVSLLDCQIRWDATSVKSRPIWTVAMTYGATDLDTPPESNDRVWQTMTNCTIRVAGTPPLPIKPLLGTPGILNVFSLTHFVLDNTWIVSEATGTPYTTSGSPFVPENWYAACSATASFCHSGYYALGNPPQWGVGTWVPQPPNFVWSDAPSPGHEDPVRKAWEGGPYTSMALRSSDALLNGSAHPRLAPATLKDDFELFFDPIALRNSEPNPTHKYELIVYPKTDATGQVKDPPTAYKWVAAGASDFPLPPTSWISGLGVQVAMRVTATGYVAEIAIPWSAFDVAAVNTQPVTLPPQNGDTWLVQLGRQHASGNNASVSKWTPTSTPGLRSKPWGGWVFSDQPVSADAKGWQLYE